jgi:hypothetical protein
MLRQSNTSLIGSWFDGIIGFLFLKSGQWLRSRSDQKWREISKKVVAPERGSTATLPVSAAPEPFKQKHLETLAHKAFPVDTQRHSSQVIAAPSWTRELQTFLANQLSIHTQRAYESDLKQFFRFLEGHISLFDLSKLAPEHVILFRKY